MKRLMWGSLWAFGLALWCAELPAQPSNNRRTEWLDRPWELAYVMYISERWSSMQEGAREANEQEERKDSAWRKWEAYFNATYFFPSRDKWAQPGDGLSVVLIEFDRDGLVRTPHNFGLSLYGRLDTTLAVVLHPPTKQSLPARILLGWWFMGLGDVSTHWAPGLCTVKQMRSPFWRTDTGYLYGPAYEHGSPYPTVGCREWAYQLGDPNRPYIDITSYMPKGSDPDGPGTYVRETMGWGYFDRPRKPVIGKHEQDWYCFHDCPDGEKPGLIADIRAWAAKRGWPVPKRPTRVPVFPDPPAKPGRYP